MKKYTVTISFDVIEKKGLDANAFLDEIENVVNDKIDLLIPIKDWPAVESIRNQSVDITESGFVHKRKK